jgi:hypothetical protein
LHHRKPYFYVKSRFCNYKKSYFFQKNYKTFNILCIASQKRINRQM